MSGLPWQNIEAIESHHLTDGYCDDCGNDHCGEAHPPMVAEMIAPNPDGCRTCWLIAEVRRLSGTPDPRTFTTEATPFPELAIHAVVGEPPVGEARS